MSAKVVLIVIGIILLVLGILHIIAGVQSKWEDSVYKKLKHKDAPANLKNIIITMGAIVSSIGLVMLVWGLLIHTKMVKRLH